MHNNIIININNNNNNIIINININNNNNNNNKQPRRHYRGRSAIIGTTAATALYRLHYFSYFIQYSTNK